MGVQIKNQWEFHHRPQLDFGAVWQFAALFMENLKYHNYVTGSFSVCHPWRDVGYLPHIPSDTQLFLTYLNLISRKHVRGGAFPCKNHWECVVFFWYVTESTNCNFKLQTLESLSKWKSHTSLQPKAFTDSLSVLYIVLLWGKIYVTCITMTSVRRVKVMQYL